MRADARHCAAALAAACFLFGSCATAPRDEGMRVGALDSRVAVILERRGLGPDALKVIDNVLRHESRPPAHAPLIVRETWT